LTITTPRTRGRECSNYDSSGPDGFSNSIDSTRTTAFYAKQKFESFVVVAINNPGIAEQYGLKNCSST
jgi:hypothetical protein